MPAPIYSLNDSVYVANIPTLSVKSGVVTKVIEGTPNSYRVDFNYPDLGTVIVDETYVFAAPTIAATYIFEQQGRYPTPSNGPLIIEEGYWKPVIRGDSGTSAPVADVTYSYNNGVYQRVGNWVHFSCTLLLTDNGTTNTTFNIGGLPYIVKCVDDMINWTDGSYQEFNAAIGWNNLPLPNPKDVSGTFATIVNYDGLNGAYGNTIWIGMADGTYAGRYSLVSDLPDNFYITLTGSYRIFNESELSLTL
jgi:hypothetical protein